MLVEIFVTIYNSISWVMIEPRHYSKSMPSYFISGVMHSLFDEDTYISTDG